MVNVELAVLNEPVTLADSPVEGYITNEFDETGKGGMLAIEPVDC